MLTALDGRPYTFELVPASTEERDAADEILETPPSESNVWLDKGFLGEDWQTDWARQGVHVWTTKRENQLVKNPSVFDHLLNSEISHQTYFIVRLFWRLPILLRQALPRRASFAARSGPTGRWPTRGKSAQCRSAILELML
jgi:hypothetical protein